MKRLFPALLTILICFTQLSPAKEKKRVLSIAPVNVGGLFVNYEEAMSSDTALSCTAGSVSFITKDENGKDSWKLSVINLGFGYYFYPKKRATKGFYWGPRIEYYMVTGTYGYTYKVTANDPYYGMPMEVENYEEMTSVSDLFTFKLQLAYRWIWKSGLCLELGMNYGYLIGDIAVDTKVYGKQKYFPSQATGTPIFNIGWAF